MKRTFVFTAAILFCAVFSSAQTGEAVINKGFTLIPAKSDSVPSDTTKRIQELRAASPAAQKALTPAQQKIIDKAANKFTFSKKDHQKEHYKILIDGMTQIAKENNLINAGISFMDIREFTEKFPGYRKSDTNFFKTFTTDLTSLDQIQLVMLTDDKNAISIAFIPGLGKDIIRAYKLSVSSDEITATDMNKDLEFLREPLKKAGAPLDKSLLQRLLR